MPAREPSPEDIADAGEDFEELSELEAFQTIAEHGIEVASEVARSAALCAPMFQEQLDLAARLHDWGKVHPAFAGSIRQDFEGRPDRPDLAKAPRSAWLPHRELYPMPDGPRRAGFRHELASALAAFELLAGHRQQHPALLGDLQPAMAAGAFTADPATPLAGGQIAEELAALSSADFDLVVYLIASHHGKLRASWQGSPHDQSYPTSGTDPASIPLRGVRDGDLLPELPLPTADRQEATVPALHLHLEPAHIGIGPRYGRSWRDRTLALQRRLGPGALAFLEALLRAADIRASRGQRMGERS